jgi:hypothetical protein
MPIAVHFEDVAVSSFSEAEVLRLKAACRDIYQSLGSIEPELEAAKAYLRPKRKAPSRRSAPNLPRAK